MTGTATMVRSPTSSRLSTPQWRLDDLEADDQSGEPSSFDAGPASTQERSSSELGRAVLRRRCWTWLRSRGPLNPRAQPRPLALAVLSLTLVTVVVALTCYAAWVQFAGHRLVLSHPPESLRSPPSGSPERGGSSGTLVDPRRELVTPTSEDGAGSGESSTTSSLRAPLTVDGTTVAVITSVVALGLGAIAQRHILRRIRARGPSDVADGPAERSSEEVATTDADEVGVAAEDHRDVESAGGEVSPEILQESDDPTADARSGLRSTARSRPDGVAAAGPTAGAVATRPGANVDDDPGDHPVNGSDAALAIPVGGESASLGPGTNAVAPTGATERSCGDGALDPMTSSRPRASRARGPVPFETRARLQSDTYDWACQTVNIDAHGVRCTLPAALDAVALPVGSLVRITLTLNGGLFLARATVTSSRPATSQHRINLQFESLDESHSAQLLRFIEDLDRSR